MTDYTNLRKIVTGDIIIKCRLGNDIRRIPINQVPTYDELCLMMYRVFKNEIKDPENIVMKYTDNEGDLISLTDDIDIDHAISISNLLKVTIFDKSSVKHMPQLQLSLIEIRDSLNELIKSFDIKKEEEVHEEKEDKEVVEMKQTRKLTRAELASFDTTVAKVDSSEEKSSVKELTTLSPKAPTSAPYYPPISQQTQQPQQNTYQSPSNNNSANNNNRQYIQTPLQQPQHLQNIPPPQTPQQNNLPVYPPPTSAPLQQHAPQQHVPQQFNPSVPSYPLPQANNNGIQRLSQQPPPQQQQNQQPQIQQQQQRPMYFNNPPPPHPSGSVSTPQVPPQQQFRPPPTHW